MKKPVLAVALICLSSCGSEKLVNVGAPSQAPPASPAAASAGVVEAPPKPPELGAEQTLIEPAEAGGAWKRLIKVQGGSVGFLSVEKLFRGQGEWQARGFTNADGRFLDEDIGEPAQYRFGQMFVSEEQPGVSDLVLRSGWFCDEKPISAFRVVIPAGETLFTGECRMSVSARIFRLDGAIQAFEGEWGGKSAGSLYVSASLVTGKGRIYLHGQSGYFGAVGAPGGRGAPGKSGGHNGHPQGYPGGMGGVGLPGDPGGNGGSVVLHVARNDLRPEQINVGAGPGGRGGPGGPGGPGGEGGSQAPPGSGKYTMGEGYSIDGADGPPGPQGPQGPSGPSGRDGKIEVLVDTALARLLPGVIGPLPLMREQR